MPGKQTTARAKKNRLEIFVCLIIFLLVVCMFIPGAQRGRSTARRTQCLNNMRNVGVAVQTYASEYRGALPATAAGQPPQSWRLLLFPYIENSPLYGDYQFEVPWNEGKNQEPARRGVEVYVCPDNPNEETTEGFRLSSYVTIIGTNAMWGKEKSLSLDDVVEADGLSQTLLIVENIVEEIPWLEPRDVNMDEMKIEVNLTFETPGSLINSLHPGGANVIFADGSGRHISEKIEPRILKALCTATGGEVLTNRDY